MKTFRFLGLMLVALNVSACVSLQPTVTADAAPVLNSGYVTARFTTNKGAGFGFGIVNIESGKDYVMPFGDNRSLPAERADQFAMIELPPGKYKIGYWVTYATLTKERSSKKDITGGLLGSPFTVTPGSVVFIGSYSATTQYLTNQVLWSIRPKGITPAEAKSAFANTYPKFSELPFTCTICLH